MTPIPTARIPLEPNPAKKARALALSSSIRLRAWRMVQRSPHSLRVSISLITGYHRRDVPHEALHRLEKLVEVAVAVEVDPEGIEVSRFAVAQ